MQAFWSFVWFHDTFLKNFSVNKKLFQVNTGKFSASKFYWVIPALSTSAIRKEVYQKGIQILLWVDSNLNEGGVYYLYRRCLPPGGDKDPHPWCTISLTNSIKAATYYISYNDNIPFFLLCFSMEINPSSCSVSFQDDTNIDAAITCLVKSIMSLEEESATADATGVKREPDNSILVLPRFNYSRKERGLGGCSGCSSLKPRRWVGRREEGMCVTCLEMKKQTFLSTVIIT